MQKDFDAWNEKKKEIDILESLPHFKARQVWWCSLGVNIGCEENGREPGKFHRPVVIIKKYSHDQLLVIPLSTKIKDHRYRFNFPFNGKKQSALLTHLKTVDVRRLTNMIGELPDSTFFNLKRAVIKNIKI